MSDKKKKVISQDPTMVMLVEPRSMSLDALAKAAEYWTTYKGIEFTSEDVGTMKDLLDLAGR